MGFEFQVLSQKNLLHADMWAVLTTSPDFLAKIVGLLLFQLQAEYMYLLRKLSQDARDVSSQYDTTTMHTHAHTVLKINKAKHFFLHFPETYF